MAVLACCSVICSQDTVFSNDSSSNQILKELQTIRELQVETSNKRQQAIQEKQRRDSLQKGTKAEDLASDYGIMARIEDNTQKDIVWDNWNVYGIVAIVVAIISAYYTWITYRAQKRTESNTKKLSQNMQRKLLNALSRHLYRNYVITYTMRTKMQDINYDGYPSEEHFEKLKVPLDNFHLDAFYEEDDKYEEMHNLYLNFRNYNEEIDVALRHITNSEMVKKTIDEDFDTLEFKVSFLTGRILDTIKKIWGDDPAYVEDLKDTIDISLRGDTNAVNNIGVDGSDNFTKLEVENLKDSRYAKLYTTDAEQVYFCEVFNHDINEERKKNERGAWKVRMIKFPDNVQRKD